MAWRWIRCDCMMKAGWVSGVGVGETFTELELLRRFVEHFWD
jgi:hypothetical protein